MSQNLKELKIEEYSTQIRTIEGNIRHYNMQLETTKGAPLNHFSIEVERTEAFPLHDTIFEDNPESWIKDVKNKVNKLEEFIANNKDYQPIRLSVDDNTVLIVITDKGESLEEKQKAAKRASIRWYEDRIAFLSSMLEDLNFLIGRLKNQ